MCFIFGNAEFGRAKAHRQKGKLESQLIRAHTFAALHSTAQGKRVFLAKYNTHTHIHIIIPFLDPFSRFHRWRVSLIHQPIDQPSMVTTRYVAQNSTHTSFAYPFPTFFSPVFSSFLATLLLSSSISARYTELNRVHRAKQAVESLSLPIQTITHRHRLLAPTLRVILLPRGPHHPTRSTRSTRSTPLPLHLRLFVVASRPS